MTEEVVAEVWRELKRYINPTDRADAAATMLSVMIDSNCDAADIRSAFAGETDVKRALTDYLDQHDTEVDDEDETDEDDWN